MIDVHYWPTPNGWKVTIMLEECGLDYTLFPVNISIGDQFKPEFLTLSPNNRMPAIVDHEPLGGGAPLALFESGAILEYLAEKTGKFLPSEPRQRYQVLQWVHWQMANLGPMMGNANHFKNYAKNLTEDHNQLVYGENRFCGEVDRLMGVMDAQLGAHPYLAGSDYTIADIISWPWASLTKRMLDEEAWEKYPNVARWVKELRGRPALERGYRAGKELTERELTEEEQATRREVLFNQNNEKVRKAREEAAKMTARTA